MKSIALSILLFISSIQGFSQTIQLQSFGPTFSNPVEIINAGDSRLFVVEQAGIVKILHADGTVNTTPFLDIRTLVTSGGERGLLGMAFAPDYNTSGRFYVNYTNTSGNTVISRYELSANPDVANTSGTILLTISQPASNHNGGKMAFGPDGFLYIGTGDGGGSGDPQDRAQNTSELLGKLLRIDVSGSTYSIPASNPFSNSPNGPNDPRPEIYAIGLRNPWKFSFDKTNGDLWIADVGQNAYEEINRVSGSGNPSDNYGWRCYEGNNHVYNSSGNCPAGGFSATIAPVAEYAHSNGKCSITGGYLYRGTSYPSFSGKYFFADYCSQEIGILNGSGNSWSMTLQTPNLTQRWTTFGEDANGELYIAGGSRVYKITDGSLSVGNIVLSDLKIYPNPSTNNVTIEFNDGFNKIEEVLILNVLGQSVKKILKPNTKQLNIYTENFVSGLYYVEISTSDKLSITKKLLIN